MLKAVIMDFDGVVIDTEVVWYEIYAHWFKKNINYDLSVVEFLQCVGSESTDLFHSLEVKQGIVIDQNRFINDTKDLFISQSASLPVKEGVTEFIQSVKSKGLKLALATSSTRMKPSYHLTRLGLFDMFDELITAENVKRIKPYPDLFLTAAKKMNASENEVVVIEDSLNGLIAGKNAKMHVLVIPNAITQYCDFTGCYRKAESLKDIDVDELIADFL